MRGNQSVKDKILSVGWNNCHIAEASVFELLFGAYYSGSANNMKLTRELLELIDVIPYNVCTEEFCEQKAILRKAGTPIEDYDLAIATTAKVLGYTLVSDDHHMLRLPNLNLTNWVERK